MGWLGLRRTPATPQLASGALGVNSTHFSECALMSLKVQFDFDSTIWLENGERPAVSANENRVRMQCCILKSVTSLLASAASAVPCFPEFDKLIFRLRPRQVIVGGSNNSRTSSHPRAGAGGTRVGFGDQDNGPTRRARSRIAYVMTHLL